MSLAISSAAVARLAACACGSCAACAPKPVLQAVSVPVAEPATRATGDSYEPSGLAPTASAEGATNRSGDADGSGTQEQPARERASDTGAATERSKDPAASKGPQQLTPDERRMVAELQARDREVRSHEAAHQAAGGGHVGGASYSYQQGPDGRQYAIGGEVPVDLSTGGGTPEAVIAKMAQVRAAAMAPADPSPQDFAVAAAAAAIAAAARQEQRALQEKEAAGEAQPPGGPQATSGITPTSETDSSAGDRRGDRDAADDNADDQPPSPPSETATARPDEEPAVQAEARRGADEERRPATRAVGAYRAAQAGGGVAALIDQRA